MLVEVLVFNLSLSFVQPSIGAMLFALFFSSVCVVEARMVTRNSETSFQPTFKEKIVLFQVCKFRIGTLRVIPKHSTR